MSAPVPQPKAVERAKAPAIEVYEPCVIQPAHCDGALAIRVLPGGRAHLNLWAHQFGTDGGLEGVLVARLCMSREVMREVALAMLSATMLSEHEAQHCRRELD